MTLYSVYAKHSHFYVCPMPGTDDLIVRYLVTSLLFATGQGFSPGTPVSPTNKTDQHDLIEILMKPTIERYLVTSLHDTWSPYWTIPDHLIVRYPVHINYKTGICCLFAKHTVLMSKREYCLARSRYNVSWAGRNLYLYNSYLCIGHYRDI